MAVPSIATITWLWHDAEIKTVLLVWPAEFESEIIIQTEINYEENIDALLPFGITKRAVDLLFRDPNGMDIQIPSDISLRNDTIDHWLVEQVGAQQKHAFLLHSGGKITLDCAEVLFRARLPIV